MYTYKQQTEEVLINHQGVRVLRSGRICPNNSIIKMG